MFKFINKLLYRGRVRRIKTTLMESDAWNGWRADANRLKQQFQEKQLELAKQGKYDLKNKCPVKFLSPSHSQ